MRYQVIPLGLCTYNSQYRPVAHRADVCFFLYVAMLGMGETVLVSDLIAKGIRARSQVTAPAARSGTLPLSERRPRVEHQEEDHSFAWQDGVVSNQTRSRLLMHKPVAPRERQNGSNGAAEGSTGGHTPAAAAPRDSRYRRRAMTARAGEGPKPRVAAAEPALGGRHHTWHQWNTLRGCPPTVKEPMENENMQQLLILAYEKAKHDMEKGAQRKLPFPCLQRGVWVREPCD